MRNRVYGKIWVSYMMVSKKLAPIHFVSIHFFDGSQIISHYASIFPFWRPIFDDLLDILVFNVSI